jgi:hypothetical protein
MLNILSFYGFINPVPIGTVTIDYNENTTIKESQAGSPVDSTRRKDDRNLLVPGSAGLSTLFSYFVVLAASQNGQL